jgi:hypothetical protein
VGLHGGCGWHARVNGRWGPADSRTHRVTCGLAQREGELLIGGPWPKLNLEIEFKMVLGLFCSKRGRLSSKILK